MTEGNPTTQADGIGICRGCHTMDGALDTEVFEQMGSCTFGCGRKIDEYKWCSTCRDHSANEYECEDCNTRYAKWSESWERVA